MLERIQATHSFTIKRQIGHSMLKHIGRQCKKAIRISSSLTREERLLRELSAIFLSRKTISYSPLRYTVGSSMESIANTYWRSDPTHAKRYCISKTYKRPIGSLSVMPLKAGGK